MLDYTTNYYNLCLLHIEYYLNKKCLYHINNIFILTAKGNSFKSIVQLRTI